MKKFTVLFSFLFITCLTAFSQDNTFSFDGKVYSYGKALKGATVEAYQAGELFYETTSKGGGKFKLELEAEKQYMVEVSKEGLDLKVIWINTNGTEKLNFQVPSFGFDVYLKRIKLGPNEELSKIPVTLIKYQPEKQEFYMDKDYSSTLKNKKKRMKETGLQRR
jgi:hypothetical protein